MRSAILFGIGIVLSLSARGAVEVPIRTDRSVRQQVDTYAELLEKEVTKVKKVKDKYNTLVRVKNQIKSLRETSQPQGAQDEAHMDLLVSVLESLPSQKVFNKKDCEKYEAELLGQFEPVEDEDSPQNPAVRPGWSVLQSLCK